MGRWGELPSRRRCATVTPWAPATLDPFRACEFPPQPVRNLTVQWPPPHTTSRAAMAASPMEAFTSVASKSAGGELPRPVRAAVGLSTRGLSRRMPNRLGHLGRPIEHEIEHRACSRVGRRNRRPPRGALPADGRSVARRWPRSADVFTACRRLAVARTIVAGLRRSHRTDRIDVPNHGSSSRGVPRLARRLAARLRPGAAPRITAIGNPPANLKTA